MLIVTIRTLAMFALLQGPSSPASSPRTPLSRADSGRMLRAARSAQSSFEAYRRNRLPTGYGSGGQCDVHIGRYCYWRGDGEDDQNPPAEEPQIARQRNGLIEMLDNAARALPGDSWIAGQHVRYLVEAGRTDDALRFASTACDASVSWCNALVGYAAHAAGRFATADSAYARALAAMDSTERCRWLDIRDLIEDELEHRLADLPCAGREQLARRLFWLAAPLYSVSQTDVLTEHLARLTRARMAERSAATDGQSWADDVRDLVVRYGWSRWYSRTPPALGSMAEASYTGHDAGTPYDFFPHVHAVDHLGHLEPKDWSLDEPRAATGYSPQYARSVHDLPHQVAVFRRGDSAAVVAAWDARSDTTLLGRPLDAALVIATDGEVRTVETRSDAAVTGRLWATALVDSGLTSLELLAAKDRRAARVRLGIPARQSTVSLSDLLLYSPGVDTPYSLEVVRDSALTSDILASARPVGVYWEAYGLPEGSGPTKFALTVEQTSVGWIHKAAEQLHLADPTTTLSISWSEVARQEHGVAGRGVRVDLGQLKPGKYRMTLTIAAGGDAAASTTKDIEIR